MRQNAVLAGLARRAASLALFLAFGIGAALAGDRAQLNVIGYSSDGHYFAYEEFGIQDGSGLAYSSIYVIDLAADKWTYGTPFDARASEDNPDVTLTSVRARALANAQESLGPRHVGSAVEILALLGDGVPDADGKTMVVANALCCAPGATDDSRFTFTLRTYPAKSPETYCTDMDVVGYALTLDDGQSTSTLHEDGKVLPHSRGCTLDYRLYAVLAPFDAKGPWVAMVSSYPFGFEGPDRRFLAVPVNAP